MARAVLLRRVAGSLSRPRFFANLGAIAPVVELMHTVPPYDNRIVALQHGDRKESKGTILALHGVGDSASSFDLIAPYLAQAGFCIVALDLPGHGYSDWTGRYAYIDYAQDVLSFIRREELDASNSGKPLMALSHSFGAEITACLACVQPTLFSKVCLIECSTFPPAAKHDLSNVSARCNDAYEAYCSQLKKATSSPRIYDTYEAAVSRRISNQSFPLSNEATRVLCRRCIRPSRTGSGYEFAHDPMLLIVGANHGSTGWTSTPALDSDQRRFFHAQCKADVLWVQSGYASKLHSEDWKTYPNLEVVDVGPLAHHVHLESPELIADIAIPFLNSGQRESE